MIKSASVGDDQEIQRQNSLSQVVLQNINMNASKNSNTNGKIQSHSRVGSRNLLLDNESSKDTMKHISQIPNGSQSQLNSQKLLEVEIDLTKQMKNIGLREGAETRSRLFLENKDYFLPKNDFSLDDIPAINDGDNSLRLNLTPGKNSMFDQASLLKLNKEYQNEIKNRPHHINSQSMTKPGSALANTIITKQQKDQSTHTFAPTFNQLSNNHNIFSNPGGSNITNNILDNGYGVAISGRKIQLNQQASSQKIPPSQTYFPYTGNGLKVFMLINHFTWAMKKILIFMRPKRLNKLQMDCINDKGASDYNDQYSKNNADLKHATRLWITKKTYCYKSVRNMKKHFKSSLKIQQSLTILEKNFPYFNPISFGWRLWELFILLVTLVNFVYIPLDYSFNIGSDIQIKDISSIIFFFEIFRLFNTAYFDKGKLVTSRQVIICTYLRTSFILDFITTISLISQPFQYTSLIFFVRFLYIQSLSEKIQEFFTNYKQIQGFINLVIIFLTVLYHCHLISCLWFYIGNYFILYMNEIQIISGQNYITKFTIFLIFDFNCTENPHLLSNIKQIQVLVLLEHFFII